MACSLSLSWAVPARRCAPRAGRAAAGLAPPRAGADDVFQCPDSSAEGFETGAPAAPAMEFCEVCSGEKSKCKHKNRPKNKVRRNGCGAFAVLCAAAPRAVATRATAALLYFSDDPVWIRCDMCSSARAARGARLCVKSKCKHPGRPKKKVRRNGCGAFAVLCAAAPRAVATRATAALLYFSDDPVWIRCDMCSSARAARGARLCVSD